MKNGHVYNQVKLVLLEKMREIVNRVNTYLFNLSFTL